MNHQRLYDIMSGGARDFGAGATRAALSVLAPGYGLAVATRNALFNAGLRRVNRLDRPVISVGNITTGGTGKTPMVIELARRLTAMGRRPAVLLRGYMAGADGPSDEAAELARELGSGVPVMANPDRVEGARRVLADHADTDVFLLDDGFQHRRVQRDLDIVLIDATRPFGFGRLLPRGLLREPVQGLKRAHAVILTRCDLVSEDRLAEVDRRIEALTGRPPTAHTAQTWSGFRSTDGECPAEHLKPLKVIGACAIGNPRAFEAMLRAAAGEALTLHAFDDHHAYTADEVRGLLAEAGRLGADAVVVTEKDWVKWQGLLEGPAAQGKLPRVLRPILGIRFLDGDEALGGLLARATSGDGD